MSQAANFTISDGTSPTPVATVFTNVQPASGSIPATYIARAKGVSTASQPVIAISSKTKNKAREVVRTIKTPYAVLGVDGVTRVVDNCFTQITTVLPDSCPTSVRLDHQAYVANSSDTAQIKESETDGYAPG